MPGLHRIILIDTHLPGVVELKLDGHTNICGTNASGKTTLQRLIPVFYGEYPSRVVPATRDSFERWYLPRESSFIIYEYRRAGDELCQVVLSSSGTGVNYRFVGKPFELVDYVFKNKAEEHVPQSPQDVVRGLKRNNVMVTNQLNTKDFRAILQNDTATLQASSNARELQGYARLFSLCENQQHIRHIEKLAKAVHSKEGKMETIKAMIAAILEEDGVQPPSSNLSRKHVDDWLRECQLIQEFDTIRPQFTKLETADEQLHSTESRLAELLAMLVQDRAYVAATCEEQTEKVKQASAKLQVLEDSWVEERETLNQALSAAKGDADKYEQELDHVEQEYQRWQDQNIDKLQSDVKRLPQWKGELDTATSRYALLTEKHNDIQSTFDKQAAELGEKLNRQLESLTEQQRTLLEKRADQQNEAQQQKAGLKDDYRTQLDALNEKKQVQLDDITEQRSLLTARVQNVGFTEFEQGQLDLADAALEQTVIDEDAAREKLRTAQQTLNTAQKQRAQSSDAVQNASKAVLQQQKVLAHAESLLHPKDNTLLAVLRAEKRDWENSIGKVIDPQLLQRTDLKPSFIEQDSEAQAHVFGLQLDTSLIDLPDYAQDEKALRHGVEAAQQKLTQLVDAQRDAELHLSAASDAVRQAELSVTKAESATKSCEATRKRAQHDKTSLQREYQAALIERKQQSKKQLQVLEQQKAALLTKHQEAQKEIAEQQREALTELDFHWQQLIEDTRNEEAAVAEQISQTKGNYKQHKQELEKWLANELADRGVDIDEIGSLKKTLEQLKKDIDHTETHRHKVADYERWYAHVFTGQKVEWQKRLAKAKQTAADTERSLTEKRQQVKSQQQQLKEQQLTAERLLRQADEARAQVEQLIKGIQKLSLNDVSDEVGAASLDVNAVLSRIGECNELLQTRDTLLSDIRAYVERFDQLIAAQAGTGLSDTWDRSREECTSIDKDGVRHIEHRRLVTHLARLLNEIVPQKMQGLREQGRIFGADLTQYYHVLDDIDKRIATQSRRISKEVDEELFLDGVSESAVKIRSRISDLEFWPELEAFQQQYLEWMESGASELPSDEYGQSMRRVLDIFGRTALTGGISKLLDIELHLKEGHSHLVIRTDRQLNESSSHGMAYLILCKFLLAFTRLLRGKAPVVVHWPIDELGTLHQSNVKKIFDACQNNAISVVGAFPNPESDVLKLFQNRYLIDKTTRQLQVVQPRVSPLSERLKAKLNEEETV
ncbi:ATP-binding protein [Alteromonas oceanisediminis]|uniref:ATP-binding protein n=1 Tax=Alteromonas oceanisediminis TaxID=2836180 RepID=UPI001BD933E3|nr:ATP-binding protein [Alteromonas oceanisediminis]MBT0585127.1 ATP-binding protein [Alteromonas oceanisediminis]